MPTILDERVAHCRVFTFKEGLLSAVAHDLQLSATRFRITVADDQSTVDGTFPVAGLVVDGAMVAGALRQDALSARQRAEIMHNLQATVLNAARHPDVVVHVEGLQRDQPVFVASASVTLGGCTRPVSMTVRRLEGRWEAHAALTQTAFGIRPFTAMMGTLRIKDGVEVRVSLPA